MQVLLNEMCACDDKMMHGTTRPVGVVVNTIRQNALDERYGVPAVCWLSSNQYSDESVGLDNSWPAGRLLPSLPPPSQESRERNALRCRATISLISDRRQSTSAFSSISDIYASSGDVLSATSPKQIPPQPDTLFRSNFDDFESPLTPVTRSSASVDAAQIQSQYEALYLQTRDETGSPSSTSYVDSHAKFTVNQ